MKNLLKTCSILAVIAMSMAAGLFVRHIGGDLYNLNPVDANIAGFACAGIVGMASFIPDVFPKGALMMAISAKAIGRNPNPANIAGLANSHYYAFVEDIASFPAALTADFLAAATFGELVSIPIADPFVMVALKFFHPFPCTEETGEVKSTLVGPTDSKAFENIAMFSNAGNNDALTGAIAYTANKPVIIIVKELNGAMKVVGNQSYAARLDTADKTGGIKVADGNLIKHTYKACSVTPPPTYLAPVPLDPAEI